MSELGRVMMESTRKSLSHCLSFQQQKMLERARWSIDKHVFLFQCPEGIGGHV